MRRVLVFGVFDLLHEGHRSFLKQARAYGDELIVVVARDRAVEELKKRRPHHNERVRRAAVTRVGGVSRAVLGDRIQGKYTLLKKVKPDIICLGYDQEWLEKDLRSRMDHGMLPKIKIIRLKSHRPHIFHTALLQKRSS